jgi:hypothetical protein
MHLRRLALLPACCALAAVGSAQVFTTPVTGTPAPGTPTTGTPTTGTTPPATAPVRAQPFASFDHASPAVRDAVAAATASAQLAAPSLTDAIRNGVFQPAGIGTASTQTLPPSVEAVSSAVTRANAAIVGESRSTRAPVLTPRAAALARLRQTQSEPERLRLIEELRTASGQRLDAQREDARLVRDRLRQLRELTTLNRPAGN